MAIERIRLRGAAAAGVVALSAVALTFSREPQFWRDPWLEMMGLVRVAAGYEATYIDCADERYERNGDLRGFALAATGRFAHKFPAWSDADAVAFARQALPDCTLTMLMRRKRFAWRRSGRIERIPVNL